MGRVFEGGYAEYTLVPREQVIPFTSDLPWDVIGAVPEIPQTAYGSLTTGLDLAQGPPSGKHASCGNHPNTGEGHHNCVTSNSAT